MSFSHIIPLSPSPPESQSPFYTSVSLLLSRIHGYHYHLSKFHIYVLVMVQLSHPYLTTGKTVALTRRTFVSKIMSLLFNMMSKFVTAFLPRSKHLLISWLQLPTAVILEPKKIVCHCFCFMPSRAMAPHSSTLAWKIPCTEEPGRLQSIGLQRVGHD